MELRPFQVQALKNLQGPGHLLCIAPTGSGKSLIYEKTAAEPGLRTLLITPLVALARQQAERLGALGIPVALYPGSHPKPPAPGHGGIKAGVWILSPESLQSEATFARVASWRPDFLVVDECHCLYDWGESFRVAFAEVPRLIRRLGIRRSLWLTATLPKNARLQLERAIGEPLTRIGEFALAPNLGLSLHRTPWAYRVARLHEQVSANREPGIIFVNTREATHRLSRLLAGFGRRAIAYHAGQSQEERRLIERELRDDSDAVLVATSAFGMGMDYAQLRWTVLWQPPPSLLALAQALGRIGRRRELPAHACVLWDEEDLRALQWMTLGSERRVRALGDLHSYLLTSGCRRRGLEARLNEDDSAQNGVPCGLCDFCAASH